MTRLMTATQKSCGWERLQKWRTSKSGENLEETQLKTEKEDSRKNPQSLYKPKTQNQKPHITMNITPEFI